MIYIHVRASLCFSYWFYFQPPTKIITPFHKEDETKNNEQKINDSMKGVKKMIAEEDKMRLRPRTEREKERSMSSLLSINEKLLTL